LGNFRIKSGGLQNAVENSDLTVYFNLTCHRLIPIHHLQQLTAMYALNLQIHYVQTHLK